MFGNNFYFSKNKYSLFIRIFVIILFGCAENSSECRVGILSCLDFFVNIVYGLKTNIKELGSKEGKKINNVICYTNFEPYKEGKIIENIIEEFLIIAEITYIYKIPVARPIM
jgi:hypothetical protein